MQVGEHEDEKHKSESVAGSEVQNYQTGKAPQNVYVQVMATFNRMEKKIDETRYELREQMEENTDKIEKKIDENTDKIEKKMNESHKLQEKMKNNNEQMQKEMDENKREIINQNKQLQELYEKILYAISTLCEC